MQLKRLFCALKRKKKTSADIFQKCKKKMYYEKKHIRGFQIFFIVLDANQRSFTFCFPLNILKYSGAYTLTYRVQMAHAVGEAHLSR